MPKAWASSVIDAPASAVWAVVRDFNATAGLPSGHRRATFGCDLAAAEENINTFANGVFQGGFDALKERLA